MMKKAFSTALLFLVALFVHAQMANPVKVSADLKMGKGAEATLTFKFNIEPSWHVYSTNLGSNGPTEASLKFDKKDGIELVGGLKALGKEINKYDDLFGMNLRYFEHNVTFVQKIKFTKPVYTIDAYLQYGACSDKTCLPPSEASIKKSGKAPVEATTDKLTDDKKAEDATAETPILEEKATLQNADSTQTTTVDTTSVVSQDELWKPVTAELQALGDSNHSSNNSLFYIFAMGFVSGLLALFTPCVWPIIPMTVSFFLKRSKDKSKGLRDAIIYGISIVVIYVSLGLGVTLIFGADKLNDLATNAVFNIIFCALLVVFALSFFGWFEIKLPEKWANSVDNKANNTSGLVSIFLMAFTLSLVSFSCTGPIVGFLLVQVSTSGNIAGPGLGMLGFALALALPFTLFALFPSLLKQAPKSGNWMNTIKIVLGFIELAFALKFFSVADLAYGWHLLDREVFLALWIVIFGMLGLYLIGKVKFPSDFINGEDKAMPVPCIALGMISLAFTVYLIPGLWGAPVKSVGAFTPPMNTQDFNLNTKEVHAAYTNYEEGMKAAREQGKPALIDFTGFGCVNCRKMEASVWTDPQVMDKLSKDYVLISLFVDDKTPLQNPITVIENGQEVKLRTVGNKWSYLQRTKFGSNTQPQYVALDHKGHALTGSFSYKEDISAYLDFLNQGLERFKAKQ